MTGILVTGGEKPAFSSIKPLFNTQCYICAADSGLDYCMENGLLPDYILGDMDSISSDIVLKNFDSSIIETHPEDKDHTDTELGLQHLFERNFDQVILVGGGGGRLDHLLAVAALFDRERAPDCWITGNEEIRLISGSYNGVGRKGETVSFFPAGSDPCRMKSRGLFWPLNTLEWAKGDIGISNRLQENEFSIEMESGRLIMIREIPAEGLLP